METANHPSPVTELTSRAYPRKGLLTGAAVLVVLFLFCLGLSWSSGLFRSEFGRYQDEGMHYITGVFMQDFLTSGQWSSPMRFAQQYYLHFPKVALGNWPPGFPLMQAAWGLVFGISRVSMLFGMIVSTAWLASLVYFEGEKYFGTIWGVLGAVLLIAAPLTQEQTGMVMAEIPLAAASFLAIAAFVRFVESVRPRDAVVFAVWTVCAIMIKGDGWVIGLAAPLILVAAGKLRLMRNVWLWIAAFLIALVCVPYTLVTMHIATQGWDTRTFPGFAYEWASLGIHLGFVVRMLGIPLTVVAVIGALVSLFSARGLFWKAMVIYAVSIVVFHVAVPSSIEPRKVFQVMPALCLLVLTGLDAVSAVLLRGKLAILPAARPALAALAALVFFFSGFSLLPQYIPGFGNAVQYLIALPASRGAAILISSNSESADSEAALISEWAERRRNDGVFLIRGTKLLSHLVPSVPGQHQWAPNFTSSDEILRTLSSIPVSFVVLHTTSAPLSFLHQAQLKAALDSDKAEWEPIYHTRQYLKGTGTTPGETHDIEIYRYRKDVRGAAIHYSVDLSGKLGAKYGAIQ